MTRSIALLLATSALVPAITPAIASAQTLPSGGTVVRGEATIATPSSTTVAINQTSDRAIINWQNFSVGAGNSVQIIQPDAQSVLLNRVTGDLSSTIAGAISANGQMFLINPNGIQITSTGSVNAAGFVASTLDIDNDRFMAGDIVVKARGTAGAISNAGQISIVRGGYAALIGGAVNNSGFIYAPLGRVALATGDQATLDLAGDGFLQVAIPTAQSGGITMAGQISADGGSVILSAASARDAARQTVNLSGVIEARGVEGRSGSVTLTGDDIRLIGATIDASGPSQGGHIRIGGDRQGNGPLTRALTLSVDADSDIRADATGAAGVGGDIVLWSDEATRFAGTISGRGAERGGEVEVSSRGILSYTGVTDLSGGRFGNLLLDPYNITISDAADSGSANFTANSNDSVLNVTTLTTA